MGAVVYRKSIGMKLHRETLEPTQPWLLKDQQHYTAAEMIQTPKVVFNVVNTHIKLRIILPTFQIECGMVAWI